MNSLDIPFHHPFSDNFSDIVYFFNEAENEYDNTGDEGWLEVEVVDPIFDNMGMEVGKKANSI